MTEDNWIHSFDDGQGFVDNKKNNITDLPVFAKFLYGIGGFIAGWLAQILADALGI